MSRPPALGALPLLLTAAAIAFTLIEVPLSVVFGTELSGPILIGRAHRQPHSAP